VADLFSSPLFPNPGGNCEGTTPNPTPNALVVVHWSDPATNEIPITSYLISCPLLHSYP